jgi:hypothetical protein
MVYRLAGRLSPSPDRIPMQPAIWETRRKPNWNPLLYPRPYMCLNVDRCLVCMLWISCLCYVVEGLVRTAPPLGISYSPTATLTVTTYLDPSYIIPLSVQPQITSNLIPWNGCYFYTGPWSVLAFGLHIWIVQHTMDATAVQDLALPWQGLNFQPFGSIRAVTHNSSPKQARKPLLYAYQVVDNRCHQCPTV